MTYAKKFIKNAIKSSGGKYDVLKAIDEISAVQDREDALVAYATLKQLKWRFDDFKFQPYIWGVGMGLVCGIIVLLLTDRTSGWSIIISTILATGGGYAVGNMMGYSVVAFKKRRLTAEVRPRLMTVTDKPSIGSVLLRALEQYDPTCYAIFEEIQNSGAIKSPPSSEFSKWISSNDL